MNNDEKLVKSYGLAVEDGLAFTWAGGSLSDGEKAPEWLAAMNGWAVEDVATEIRRIAAADVTPHRIQLRRTKGFRLPPNTVCVTRPGKWGNPFRVDGRSLQAILSGNAYVCLTREEAVERFRQSLDPDGDYWGSKMFYDAKRELRGKNLACWCKIWDENGLRVPCHADVLLKIANA